MADHSSIELHSLPVDLVRMIFEFGASQSQSTAVTLVRVSRTVRGWITPLLYETVILQSPRSVSFFYHTIQVARSTHAAHVRTLYLPPAPSLGTSPAFLTNFPALRHLAINSMSLRLPRQVSLSHCVSPRPTSITITGRLGRIPFEHPIFQHCTHLYLADDVPTPLSLTMDIFPRLTHLACGYRHGSSSTTAITSLPLLLHRKNDHVYAHPESASSWQSPSSMSTYPVELKVLVVEMYLSNGNPDATMFVMECLGLGKASLRADPRLILRPGVTLTAERWKSYVVSNVLWTTAEREIRSQSMTEALP